MIPAWLRCENCYATGYVVVTTIQSDTVNGRISNKKCDKCNGTGYQLV